eukprot:4517995-Ditylum_brightwellii.AAC.1
MSMTNDLNEGNQDDSITSYYKKCNPPPGGEQYTQNGMKEKKQHQGKSKTAVHRRGRGGNAKSAKQRKLKSNSKAQGNT